jgi:hypothetical protein
MPERPSSATAKEAAPHTQSSLNTEILVISINSIDTDPGLFICSVAAKKKWHQKWLFEYMNT